MSEPSDPEGPPQPAPDRDLPPIPTRLGGYDGPTDAAGRHEEAKFLATARCALHPLYRRSPGDCLLLLYRAQALNIPIGLAVDHIYINTGTGKAGLTAQLMSYLLLRAGITWTTVRSNRQVVELKFYRGRGRRKRAVGTVKWEIDEAVTARIAHRQHWLDWPEECMRARCIPRAVRALGFTDVVMGMSYSPEELFDMRADETAPEQADAVPDDVAELLGQADDDTATPDLIRTDIMVRARKAKLHTFQLADGQTLQQHLEQVWRYKTAMLEAARADAVTRNVAEPAAAPTAVLDAPAGEGTLPCGCPAEQVIATGSHLDACTAAVVPA
jgi:hypothetical protein